MPLQSFVSAQCNPSADCASQECAVAYLHPLNSDTRAQPGISKAPRRENNHGRATCNQRKANATLCRIYTLAEALKEWVSALRTGLDGDMEAIFYHSARASEELTGIITATNSIRTSTTEAQNTIRAILERLREVRIMINVKRKKALE